MKHLKKISKFLVIISILMTCSLSTKAQVMHVDYIQTAGTNTSFSVEVWISKTNPEPMVVSALNTVFTYPSMSLSQGTVSFVLAPPFNALQALTSSYITSQLKIRSTQNPIGSAAQSITVTSTPQLFGTFTVTSAANITYPLSITPATAGNPTVQAIVYHNGSTNSVALTLVGGTITTDESPLVLQLLPIKLHNFSAEKVGERRARLSWSSSSEINSSHFEVERSEDAENFEKLGEIKAAGNSQSLLKYEFFDNKIEELRTQRIYYYRLKMVDLDGSYEYSDIRGLNFGNDLAGVFMYPNPTNQWLNVDVSGVNFEDSSAELNVFDFEGKLLMTKEVIGSGIEAVDLGQFSAGLYHVVLKKGREVYNEKVVVID